MSAIADRAGIGRGRGVVVSVMMALFVSDCMALVVPPRRNVNTAVPRSMPLSFSASVAVSVPPHSPVAVKVNELRGRRAAGQQGAVVLRPAGAGDAARRQQGRHHVGGVGGAGVLQGEVHGHGLARIDGAVAARRSFPRPAPRLRPPPRASAPRRSCRSPAHSPGPAPAPTFGTPSELMLAARDHHRHRARRAGRQEDAFGVVLRIGRAAVGGNRAIEHVAADRSCRPPSRCRSRLLL